MMGRPCLPKFEKKKKNNNNKAHFKRFIQKLKTIGRVHWKLQIRTRKLPDRKKEERCGVLTNE